MAFSREYEFVVRDFPIAFYFKNSNRGKNKKYVKIHFDVWGFFRYEILTPSAIPKGFMDGRKACQLMVREGKGGRGNYVINLSFSPFSLKRWIWMRICIELAYPKSSFAPACSVIWKRNAI